MFSHPCHVYGKVFDTRIYEMIKASAEKQRIMTSQGRWERKAAVINDTKLDHRSV